MEHSLLGILKLKFSGFLGFLVVQCLFDLNSIFFLLPVIILLVILFFAERRTRVEVCHVFFLRNVYKHGVIYNCSLNMPG